MVVHDRASKRTKTLAALAKVGLMDRNGNKRSFGLIPFFVWVTAVGSLLAFLRAGFELDAMLPFFAGLCLLGVGIAFPLVFLRRIWKGAVALVLALLIAGIVLCELLLPKVHF